MDMGYSPGTFTSMDRGYLLGLYTPCGYGLLTDKGLYIHIGILQS